VPVKEGITRNLTASSNAHDRSGFWSPDGKWIAYLSDLNGEYDIYIQKQDGSEPAVQLTSGADTYKFTIRWSPDSNKILWNDKLMRLQYIDIESKKVTQVDKSRFWEFNNFDWSPDSKWIAYSQLLANQFTQVVLYNLESAKKYEVTDEWFSSDQPTFSRDGKYLVFTSERTFEPTYSNVEWNYAYEKMSKIYLVALAKDTPSPFAPTNDEVKIDEPAKSDADTKKDTKGKKDDKKEKAVATSEASTVKIDLEGIQQRIIELPIKASNYFNLWMVDDKVYYNEPTDDGISLKMFDLKAKKDNELGSGMAFDITANGKKMMIAQNNKYAVIDLPSSKISIDKYIDMSDLKVWVDYRKEWNQIYDEAWRQMRDFFYVPNMHGVDWKAMHDKYAVMLPNVNNRNDLTYLIGELIGECRVRRIVFCLLAQERHYNCRASN
ncbi:MAG: protease, partial [Desulfobulbaceae bacterium]|nr:protease [Desulfobulbaceae bacterium]